MIKILLKVIWPTNMKDNPQQNNFDYHYYFFILKSVKIISGKTSLQGELKLCAFLKYIFKCIYKMYN